ncbi:hypothetical protein CIL03_18150 [Virgibacillus indicus]|uniref:Uncharacterized protein n=1 Tax=Virgibacillus indicus TaxID=2024554 RepID=A0A265N5V1_9BACI|nr:hypothetical protein [Virgibacillus indicus]OZU87215.1 hypothetical protein CIL03_18150 [Virgibacillus indicus]
MLVIIYGNSIYYFISQMEIICFSIIREKALHFKDGSFILEIDFFREIMSGYAVLALCQKGYGFRENEVLGSDPRTLS